jgi:lytic cellulose monooxygenase (C1-hydroxylating)
MLKHCIILLSFIALSVDAHTRVFSANNGQNCIRPTTGGNNPIKDINSRDMTCGIGASGPARSPCTLQSGSKLNLQYGHNRAGDDIIATSHHGPCNVYLVPVDGFNNAPRSGWIKIYQAPMADRWCTDALISNKGVLSVPIPSSIKSGKYIVRTEIAALHEANRQGGNQFYVNCADIILNNGDSQNTQTIFPGSVSIPGYLNPSSPGVLYNIYGNKDPSRYPTLGPAVSLPVNSPKLNSNNANSDKTTSTSQSAVNSKPTPESGCSNSPGQSSGRRQRLLHKSKAKKDQI